MKFISNIHSLPWNLQGVQIKEFCVYYSLNVRDQSLWIVHLKFTVAVFAVATFTCPSLPENVWIILPSFHWRGGRSLFLMSTKSLTFTFAVEHSHLECCWNSDRAEWKKTLTKQKVAIFKTINSFKKKCCHSALADDQYRRRWNLFLTI